MRHFDLEEIKRIAMKKINNTTKIKQEEENQLIKGVFIKLMNKLKFKKSYILLCLFLLVFCVVTCLGILILRIFLS